MKGKSSKSKKPALATAKRAAPHGWQSSDEDEIERRRQRAATESIAVQSLRVDGFYGDFLAGGDAAGRGAYRVEVRALERQDNTCNCMDFRKNGLGTCKHIEAVLSHLRAPGIRAYRRAAVSGSPFAEVYLARRGAPEVLALLPSGLSAAARRLLATFFDSQGRLLAPPTDAVPSLVRALEKVRPSVRTCIRVSQDVEAWVREAARREERATARARFLADVAEGRRTLDVVKGKLYPYQTDGMLHLAFGERALLADEMGLGKTVQAVAACELLRRTRGIERVLVVSPASLKTEWEEQIARFTDQPALPVWGPRAERLRLYRSKSFFYLCNYEQALADWREMNELVAPDVVILDEAQRIKNWQTRTARTIKQLQSPYAFVLTGTPLENRIDEVYSIVEFLDPTLFGSLFRFNREFYELDEKGRPSGFRNLDELHRRLRPIMLRRRKDEVEEELPPRTVKNFFVKMDDEQAARYAAYEARVAKIIAIAQRRPLMPDEFDKLQRWLACMRMICDTPFILDPECRISPKLRELDAVLDDLCGAGDEKIIIFSEWERMLELVRELAGGKKLGFAWHTGSVPQQKRRAEINRFKQDPACRLFLSTDSGATGLNLQAASVVINLDLPWNPAKLEQRIARAWRKHQTRPVTVINLVCENSIEHRMLGLLAGKQELADGVLDGRGELAALKMPGGRKAFMERIGTIMGASATTPPAAVPAEAPAAVASRGDPLTAFKQDLSVRLDARLLLLQSHTPPTGLSTLLAVVDGDAEQVRPVAERLLHDAFQREGGAAAPALELMDRSTFEAIRRLEAAGVLQFSTASGSVLHGGLADTEAENEKRRRRAGAEALIAQGQRKARMGRVLRDGGFAAEATQALCEAVETALRALVTLVGDGGEAPEAPIPAGAIEATCVGSNLLDAAAVAALCRLRAARDDVSATPAALEAVLASGDALLLRIQQIVAAHLLR
jgi:superfamily II DNA or RNA helicase